MKICPSQSIQPGLYRSVNLHFPISSNKGKSSSSKRNTSHDNNQNNSTSENDNWYNDNTITDRFKLLVGHFLQFWHLLQEPI